MGNPVARNVQLENHFLVLPDDLTNLITMATVFY